jgi:hypothetical protein
LPDGQFARPIGSELAALLKKAGHDVRQIGTHECLMPISEIMPEHDQINKITRQQIGVGVAAVFQFDLPFG